MRTASIVSVVFLGMFLSAGCGGTDVSSSAWYHQDSSFEADAAGTDVSVPDGGISDVPGADGGGTDTGGPGDGGDAGREPCDEEKVAYHGCTGGDLITPCLDGWYGEPYCQLHDAGGDSTPADGSGDGGWDGADAGHDAGFDSGFDAGPFPDAGPDPYEEIYKSMEGLTEEALRDALYDLVRNHNGLGYDDAREVLFSYIDNENGRVQCVYTGKWVETTGIPQNDVMNTEHTWPQSKGADVEPARSDLNHLYPTDSRANSRRSNNDFGWVENATWTEGGSKLGTDAKGQTVFEPRDEHKGNAARSILYFSIRYRLPVPQDEEDAIKVWNHLDPPDDRERERNSRIQESQNTRNPFVDHPEFADRVSDF